jgi:hypothetical protein
MANGGIIGPINDPIIQPNQYCNNHLHHQEHLHHVTQDQTS